MISVAGPGGMGRCVRELFEVGSFDFATHDAVGVAFLAAALRAD